MARKWRVVALAGAMTIAVAALAIAYPSNGGFEKGNLKGWKTFERGGGDWRVYREGEPPPPPPGPRGLGPVDFPPPPRGEYAALVRQGGPGVNILHRRLRPKDGADNELKFMLAYHNSQDRFYTPNSFEYGGGAMSRGYARGAKGSDPNQQLIIDLIKPKAPIRSLRQKHILARLFRTRRNDRLRRKYFKLSFDLNQLGVRRPFRLRIAEVDNQGELLVGVDAVKLIRKD